LRGLEAEDDDVRHEILPFGLPAVSFRHASVRLKAAGFSLVEMLTTMSILAILLVVASPGLASLTSANALSSAQSELASAMMMARGEAMKRGIQVGLAAAAPVAGTEFTGGWTIFVDANGNGLFDAGETIVRQQPAYRTNVRISASHGTTTLAFNARGFLVPSSLVTFTLCSSAASKGYQLRVEPVGLSDLAETAGCP
jgi:type IV fimbrial biogenesis protein FimT